jgi:hypothetical protein
MIGGARAPGTERRLVSETICWRPDLDAVEIAVPEHSAVCLIHRLAFRALIDAATLEACLSFTVQNQADFLAAARAKIARDGIPPGRTLSINSRDIRRALAGGR